MRVAILAIYPPRVIVEMLMFAPILLLSLFGITSIAIGGFYAIRIVAAYLRGKSTQASQERFIAASQASDLARLALACGPLLSFTVGLVLCIPALILERKIGLVMGLGVLLGLTGVGAVAGLIAGGAFWVSSGLLGRYRKAVKRLKGSGVWDPDLDGMP